MISNIKYIILILFTAINLQAITISILPFTSTNEYWITNYAVDDGIPRTLENTLIETHSFNITDYDLLISYFASYEEVYSYKTLATNLKIAAEFVKETFNTDYVITGEVIDFSLRQGGKDTATVAIKINLIDVNNLKKVNVFTNMATFTLPNNSKVYKSEDAMFYETALGGASTVACSKIANDIANYLKNPPLSGIITRIEDNNIYINLGKKNKISIGDTFDIYKIERIVELPNKIEDAYSITNTSNILKKYTNENKMPYDPYKAVRTNEEGDIWYTSETLYKYRFFKKVETFITSATVIELSDNFAILEKKDDKKVDLLMTVRIKK